MASFGKNILNLTAGNIVAQGINLVAIPIITRIYSPDDYGIFAIYLAITTILSPIATLHFDRVMMIIKNQEDAKSLLGISLLSVLAFSLFLAGVILILNVVKILSNSSIGSYIWFIPLSVCIQGSCLILLLWSLREKLFFNLAVSKVSESFTDKLFVLSAGLFFNFNACGLIGGRILGPFSALCYLAFNSIHRPFKNFFRFLSFSSFKRLVRRYKGFQFFSILSDFIGTVSREAPIFLITLLFSSTSVGYYAIAIRVIRMPMFLIGDAISKAFLQRAASSEKGENLKDDTLKLFGFMIYFIFPPLLVLLNFGKDIFGLILGSEWYTAGVFAQILALSFLCLFLYRPLSALFDVYEKQKHKMIFSSLLFLARAGSIFFGAYLTDSIYTALLFLTATTVMVYVFAYLYLFYLVGVHPQKCFTFFAKKIAIMTPIILGLPLCRYLLFDYKIISAVLLFFFLTCQIIFILFFDSNFKKEIIRNLNFLTHHRI